MARHVRLLTWNILHGGGPRRVPEIALALVGHRPDVVVLTEYRAPRGGSIRGALADAGLAHAASSQAREGQNGILVASRFPVRPGVASGLARLLDLDIPDLGLSLTGVHVPDDGDVGAKAALWQRLIAMARERANRAWVVLGDFNTARSHQDADPGAFKLESLLGTFLTLGMRDAWRHLHGDAREESWSRRGSRGGRIDAAFVSKPLGDRILGAAYSHGERRQGLSDHSVLWVDLASDEATGAGGNGGGGTGAVGCDAAATGREGRARRPEAGLWRDEIAGV